MKTLSVTLSILFFMLLFVESGCEPSQVGNRKNGQPLKPVNDCNEFSFYAPYTPVKIDIIPLTEFIGVNDAGERPTIRAYVSLLDSFGYQIKAPGIFRFELYEKVPRSADPKGKRISIWPDVNLNDVVENNLYWRDFLRAYEFNLPSESESDQNYILEATCISPNGKRLSADFALTQTK
ncbi:MAG: hypothetical protein GWN67_16645 [Phycisphaerae bacterium]|nr:hypothetical protein [Phycisphaerae bacterium]NIR67486.1 hypothetical protein [candidate division Zixibacteria bacterium]NIS52783.1 hypothetical protein [Phycisphaerae bacterium]NIU08239.1 hypothetical protein [Phycisphaerae bacterium]NIU57957.1 hypothetical protein [Phycisphaerae bacterium]